MRMSLTFNPHLTVLDRMRGYKQDFKYAFLTDFYTLKITYINQIALLFTRTLLVGIALKVENEI